MKRIDAYGATLDNKFTSGNPVGGVPATRLSADFMNIIQEEIAGVVEAAGLTLDQGTSYESGHDTTQLLEAIKSLSTPIGSIQAFGGTTLPTGWVDCDGQSYLRTEYPQLFDAIGTAWGAADSTHFNVPDLRGRFLRGQDDGAGFDPNAASRTASNPGGNTGDAVGSYQADGVGSHTHSFSISLGDNNDDTANPPAASNGSLQGVTYNGTTGSGGGLETRPKNASVKFMIRAGVYVDPGL